MDSSLLIPIVLGLLLIVSFANGNVKWKPQFWRTLAEQTGLTFRMNWFLLNPQLTGTYRGFPVVIENFTENKPIRDYIIITVKVRNPKAAYFSIIDKDFPLSVFDEAYYSLPNKLENRALDQRFRTSGQIENFAKSILTNSAIQNRLIKMPQLHIQLWGQELRYKKIGLETDVLHIQAVLSLLILLAQAIDQPLNS